MPRPKFRDDTTNSLQPIAESPALAPSPVPGLLQIFAAGTAVYRPIPLRVGSAISIGRSDAYAQVLVDDARSSRLHATVVHDGTRLMVRDEKSDNGTFADGERVEGNGWAQSRLRIGENVFLVARDLNAYVDPGELLPTHGIVAGRALREILTKVSNAAALGMTILVLAETGSGKEIVARWYHAHGRWPRGELVAVNAAQSVKELDEALYFGTAKNVHSRAVADTKGYFQRAHHGTLFIDEVGDMPEDTQKMLLRALDSAVVTPVGGVPTKLELGLVLATNKDLEAEIAAGRFRSDFYYRIARAIVRLPPLRERPEEIPFHLVRWASARNTPKPVGAEMVDAALGCEWTGNVRDLEAAVEQTIFNARADEPRLSGRDIPKPKTTPSATPPPAAMQPTAAPTGTTPQRALNVLEVQDRDRILAALAMEKGHLTNTAKRLEISRSTLAAKMERYGLKDPAT